MYRWQSLTLARIEFLKCSTGQYETIRQILMIIGTKGFVTPSVTKGQTEAEGHRLNLHWEIEGREWTIIVDSAGLCSERWGDGDEHFWSEDEYREVISERVKWLLFGEIPC